MVKPTLEEAVRETCATAFVPDFICLDGLMYFAKNGKLELFTGRFDGFDWHEGKPERLSETGDLEEIMRKLTT